MAHPPALRLLLLLPVLATPATACAGQPGESAGALPRNPRLPAEVGREGRMDGQIGPRPLPRSLGQPRGPAQAGSIGTPPTAQRPLGTMPGIVVGDTDPGVGGVAQESGDASATTVPTRSAASRIEGAVDLGEFGRAVGDGGDATAAIKAAMASTGAPTVKLSAGVYGLAAGTYAAGSAVSLVGDGAGKSVIRLPAHCAQAGDLLHWVGRDHVLVQDLTVDLNGCTARGLSGGLAVAGGHGLRLVRVAIVGAGAGPWLLASLNGVSNAQVVGSRFEARAAQATQNQGINISASYAKGDDVLMEGNTLVNTGALANATHVRFLGNDVSGWGYGAGISTNPVYSADATIADNALHDSGTGQDADGAWPNGIESWGPRAVITGNRVANVAAGLFVGGANSTVNCNVVVGAGKRADGAGEAGIGLGYVSDTQNANGSTLLGNVVVNDGTGTTLYGLRDSDRTTGVYAPLAANTFTGAVAAVRISGGTDTGERATGAASPAEVSRKRDCGSGCKAREHGC